MPGRRRLGACIADGCDRDAIARDLCMSHYKRQWKHGDANYEYQPERRPLAERFKEKYQVDPVTGCWNWTGATTIWRYGAINGGGRGRVLIATHVSWEIHKGEPIPPGLCALHRCDNPPCVN